MGTQRGHRRGGSSTSSVASQSRPAVNAQLEELEQALHQLKARVNTHCVQVDSLRNAIEEEAVTNVVVPVRHFLPSTTSDEMAADFDQVLAIIERMKHIHTSINWSITLRNGPRKCAITGLHQKVHRGLPCPIRAICIPVHPARWLDQAPLGVCNI